MIRSDVPFWRITLTSPIEPGKTTVLNVEVILSHILEPYPSRITQSEKQFIVYNGNFYLYAPYKVKTQTTVIKLPSSKVESYTKTKKPVSLSDSVITYGPYENAEPFSIVSIHVV